METKLDRALGLRPISEKKTFLGKIGRATRNGILFMTPGMFLVWSVKNSVNEIIERENGSISQKHMFDYKPFTGLNRSAKTINTVRNTLTAPIWGTQMLVKGLVREVLNSGKGGKKSLKKRKKACSEKIMVAKEKKPRRSPFLVGNKFKKN